MSLKGNTIEEQLYNAFIDVNLSSNGACALMANIFCESGFKANNLQNSFNRKLGLTDEEYTKQVDNGTYQNFVHDSAGYGLEQWTYWSRKENMQKYHEAMQKSIGDTEAQIGFIIYELSASYRSIFEELKTNKSIRELSDLVLTKLERPADQSDAVKEKRASIGYLLYDTLVLKRPNNAESGTETNTESGTEVLSYSRQAVVDLIKSWEGFNEADGSHKQIVDVYNSFAGDLPRGTKMQYDWSWCACTWSALAIQLGYTDVMPIEISCRYLIEMAKQMNCWEENDGYVPQPADAVLYDWQDNGIGDNTGVPDHVGTVIEVNKVAGYIVVMEGNYSDAVKRRTISIDGKFIRGYITPHYTDNAVASTPLEPAKDINTVAHEVIAGTWGNNPSRRQKLEAAGYNYDEVQARVMEILNNSAIKVELPKEPVFEQFIRSCVFSTENATEEDPTITGRYIVTADLFVRNGAGKDRKAILVLPKGYEVKSDKCFTTVNGTRWYFIQTVVEGILYTGFSSSKYLQREE